MSTSGSGTRPGKPRVGAGSRVDLPAPVQTPVGVDPPCNTFTSDASLVEACLAHDRAAVIQFDKLLSEAALSAVKACSLPLESLAEVLQSSRRDLLVGRASGPSLARYRGPRPLCSWLDSELLVRATREAERRGYEQQTMSDFVASRNPEVARLRNECAPEFESAVRYALECLSAKDRCILNYSRHGITDREIAGLYRVPPETVSGWIREARQRVLALTKERLAQRLQLSEDDANAIVRALRILKISITAVFARAADPGHE
jgi:RNA polymerase sigma-70 factor, ECF subfamily